jgi:hypothetical protein
MAVIGPIILQTGGGYAFAVKDETGVRTGFTYRRLQDAQYAHRVAGQGSVVCRTIDEFDAMTSDLAQRQRSAS